MADRRRPSDGELDLWARATKDVRPLRHAPRISRPLPAAPLRRGRKVANEPGDSDRRQDPGPAVQSMDEKLRRKIRRGRAGIEAKLDLHGHYQAEAYRAVSDGLALSRKRGRRRVLVISNCWPLFQKMRWRQTTGYHCVKNSFPMVSTSRR